MELLDHLVWYHHASFFIPEADHGLTLYIDPVELPEGDLPRADILFITHAHHDHFSPHDIARIASASTMIVAPEDVCEQITDYSIHPVMPGHEYDIHSLHIETVAAYNTHQDSVTKHPRANNWVGYILTLGSHLLYHAGDTDFVPEMQTLKEKHITLALLPMGGTYTMDVAEAVEAANSIQATYTAPIHYKRLLPEEGKKEEDYFLTHTTTTQGILLQQKG